MKRQVNLMVKLLVMLTLTLQVMPFSVVAETLAQTPVTATTTENKAVIEQLTGQALKTYLETLSVSEQEQVKASLSDAQVASLATINQVEPKTSVSEIPPETASTTKESEENQETTESQLMVAQSSLPSTVAEATETSTSVSEETQGVAAANFLQAGPLASTLADASESNLMLNKTATYNAATQTVDFQLEAYAKGQLFANVPQTDVVFVLDVSRSMDDKFGDSSGLSKLAALQKAVKDFANKMVTSQASLTSGQYHTMRIVTYGGTSTIDPVIYETNNSTKITSFNSKINGLSLIASTRQDLGLNNAEQVVTTNKAVANRNANQVVILFTDGEPASAAATDQFIAGTAVNTARRIKNNLGATVYSIGIQRNANANIIDRTDIPNSMLNGISSNYLAATVPNPNSYSNSLVLGSLNPKGRNYYLTTSNADGLSRIFDSIATEIGKIDNLTIRDVLTEEPFFSSAKTSIDLSTVKVYKAWTYVPTLTPIANAAVSYGATTRTVDIKNVTLDPVIFNGSTPTEASKNNKLIVRFSVKVQEDFMGGNQVITNEAVSGAYTSSNGTEQLVKLFDVPKVNIPLKDAGIRVKDQKIYLGNSAQVGDFYTNLSKLDGKNNSYVNVTYKIEKGSNILAEKIILAGTAFQDAAFDSIKNETEDVVYKVSYSVVPALTATPSVTPISQTQNANVYVFKPLLTAPDRKIYLTNSLNMSEKLPTITEWQHPKAATLTQLDFTGVAPTVTGATAATMNLMTEEVVNGSINQVTLSNNAQFNPSLGFKVYVFRPEITSSNKRIDLGESTTLQERKASTAWKNTKTALTGIEGTEPVLVVEPQKVGNTVAEPATVTPNETTDYYWLVKANNQDISHYASQVNSDYGATPKPTGAHFTVYVDASNLTITKQVVAEGPRGFGDETFLFEITWKNGQKTETYYETITLNSNQTSGQTRLAQLKAGTYTIKEISEWSSRYDVDIKQKEVQISSKNPGQATFKNTLKNQKWLSYESKVVNTYNPVPEKRADVR